MAVLLRHDHTGTATTATVKSFAALTVLFENFLVHCRKVGFNITLKLTPVAGTFGILCERVRTRGNTGARGVCVRVCVCVCQSRAETKKMGLKILSLSDDSAKKLSFWVLT